MKTPVLVLALFLASLFCTACSRRAPSGSAYLTAHLGEECVVQFRRDALGGSASLPVSPLSTNINGADVVQLGTLRGVEPGALFWRKERGPARGASGFPMQWC